jgi:tripartite-type tricarboxylate transporter receptor subunit TctC
MRHTRAALAATVAVAAALTASSAAADPIADFYKGRTVTIYVGAGAGGTYSIYSHLLAEHLGRRIPGAPNIIVQIGGAGGGGVVVANYMQNVAAKDGSVIGMVLQTIPVHQVLRPAAIKYDARDWQWIGGLSPTRNALAVWHTAPAKTLDDLKRVEVVIGSTGKGSPTHIVPAVMNQFLGTKFKIVAGYKGSADLGLAIERGEISAFAFSWIAVVQQWPHWIAEKKVKPLVVDGLTRDPDMPDLPRLSELTSDPQHRKVLELIGLSSEFGRSYFAPPGVPRDRLAALRAAFAATVKDPDFLADAKKRNLVIEPQTAGELEGFVRQVHALPADVVQLAQNVMGAEN